MPRKKAEPAAEQEAVAVVKKAEPKTSGKIQYQCRRCMERFLDSESCNSIKLELQRSTMTTYRQMYRVHDCGDGHVGLAEIIGAQYDK